jgi:hypothetical protein
VCCEVRLDEVEDFLLLLGELHSSIADRGLPIAEWRVDSD